jgi:hypothetical protein
MPCFRQTDCIAWVLDPFSGEMSAVPLISTVTENDIHCTFGGGGLFVPKNLQVDTCTTFPPSSAAGVPTGVLEQVIEAGVVTLTNPTTDRVMNVIFQIAYGAIFAVMNAQTCASVRDYLLTGLTGFLPPFQPVDNVGDYSYCDFNAFGDQDLKSQIGFSGRTVPKVLCPSLPPGKSAELKYQRTISVSGAGLADFLLQPTVVNIWGIVV